MNPKIALQEIGFDEHETKIYLYLLKAGPNLQQQISDKTGILRQTVYDVIKKMEAKGYLATSTLGKRVHYVAVDPRALLQQLKNKEEQFVAALPQFEEIKSSTQVTLNTSSFIGIQGLKNLFSLSLESSTEILWMTDRDLLHDVIPDFYWKNYAKKRIERKKKIKMLINPSKKKFDETDKKELRETKRHLFIQNLDASYVLFEDKVIIFSLAGSQSYGVFIQNKKIHDSLKKLFMSLWKQAK